MSGSPASWIAPFTVTPARFSEHLEAIAAAGASTLTVSGLVDARRAGTLPPRPVLVTFDDGFAETRLVAQPRLEQHGMSGTVYVTTSFMGPRHGPQGDAMLDDAAVRDLAAAGFEIGGHSHSHAQLDAVTLAAAHFDIVLCRSRLEDALGAPVRSFAYPHGYSSARVRRIVRDQGFDSACGVGNALSHDADDPYRLSRLMIRHDTTAEEIAGWVAGVGAPLAPARERPRTRAWRTYRRLAVRTGLRRPVTLD